MTIITDLKEQIQDLENQIRDIQEKCSHPVVISQWHQETDEYGAEDGPGWYSCHCRLCDNRWTQVDKP